MTLTQQNRTAFHAILMVVFTTIVSGAAVCNAARSSAQGKNLEGKFLAAATAAAKSGGSSGGGGGGSAVACFAAPEDAQAARDARAQNIPLPRDLVHKITTLQLTDYWEHGAGTFIPPKTNEDSGQYIIRILQTYLAGNSPSFLKKVEEALKRVSLDNDKTADETGHLLQIDDTGVVGGDMDTPEFGHCALVQVAVRYAQTDRRGRIETVVGLDRDLFTMLGLEHGQMQSDARVINQGMLRLHEALYLLGYGLGQKTSEEVRAMTANLTSLDFFTHIQNLAMVQATHARNITVSGLAALGITSSLYQNGFAKFPFVEKQNIPKQKLDLAEGFAYTENILISSANFGLPQGLQVSPAMLEQIRVAAISSALSNASGPAAFMFTAHLALAVGKNIDIYSLLDPDADTRGEMRSVCNYAGELQHEMKNDWRPDSQLVRVGVESAVKYCDGAAR